MNESLLKAIGVFFLLLFILFCVSLAAEENPCVAIRDISYIDASSSNKTKIKVVTHYEGWLNKQMLICLYVKRERTTDPNYTAYDESLTADVLQQSANSEHVFAIPNDQILNDSYVLVQIFQQNSFEHPLASKFAAWRFSLTTNRNSPSEWHIVMIAK